MTRLDVNLGGNILAWSLKEHDIFYIGNYGILGVILATVVTFRPS